ncbi:hypothetical protein BKA70DRAFT_259921 [Coprinopsis sp. MPI-PUGE-AT-0042]|nr:hypothetical protein BKA70DRAFT_259921 [Coprinopsis sp. MPI-PUGE-AT-0042]
MLKAFLGEATAIQTSICTHHNHISWLRMGSRRPIPTCSPTRERMHLLSVADVQHALSTVTKSGVIRDELDTPMCQVRHLDGRLLRGGIGLTMGLGWTDSEDEDAPSPLPRRLSTLTLSRRSSASSILSTSSRSPHPLWRSCSSGT